MSEVIRIFKADIPQFAPFYIWVLKLFWVRTRGRAPCSSVFCSSAAGALCFRICRPSVRPLSVSIYFACCDISLLNGGISTTLGTNFLLASGHCWKGSQGQKLKVKVMTRPNAIMADACISTVWPRGAIVFAVRLLSIHTVLLSTTVCLSVCLSVRPFVSQTRAYEIIVCK